MSLLGDDKTLLVRLDSFIRELTPDKFSFYRSRFTKLNSSLLHVQTRSLATS